MDHRSAKNAGSDKEKMTSVLAPAAPAAIAQQKHAFKSSGRRLKPYASNSPGSARNGGKTTSSGTATKSPAPSTRSRGTDPGVRRGNDAGRGMLSALVLSKDALQPGSGFFALAAELGHDVSEPERFWLAEFNKVHADWAPD